MYKMMCHWPNYGMGGPDFPGEACGLSSAGYPEMPLIWGDPPQHPKNAFVKSTKQKPQPVAPKWPPGAPDQEYVLRWSQIAVWVKLSWFYWFRLTTYLDFFFEQNIFPTVSSAGGNFGVSTQFRPNLLFFLPKVNLVLRRIWAHQTIACDALIKNMCLSGPGTQCEARYWENKIWLTFR